jgi:hypothetical protein
MAELTHLEEKLAEVTGLAMAAEQSSKKVKKLARKQDESLVNALQKMAEEAAETAKRCKEVAGGLDGKKSAIEKKARETKQKASEMMQDYLDDEADALDGFEFLTMAEAGEVGHWHVLQTMASSGTHRQVQQLAQWALPIQERHFQTVLEGSKTLAAEEDPDETS